MGPNGFVVGLQPLGISVVRRKTLWKNLQTKAELCLLLKYLQALPGSFTNCLFALSCEMILPLAALSSYIFQYRTTT